MDDVKNCPRADESPAHVGRVSEYAAMRRCPWADESPEMRAYHDDRWGKPEHDDREIFRMMILEGQQAGLSWATILHRMGAMDLAYAGFDPERLAAFDEEDVKRLLADPYIIRNRLKVRSAIANARAFLRLREEGGLGRFLWSFTDGETIVNHPRVMADIPAHTPLSKKISAALKKRGFSFVGSVIVYSLMQAIGMVDDHLESCPFKYARDDFCYDV